MIKAAARLLLLIATCFLACAHAQTPQSIVQRVADSELAANQRDHSRWLYREEIRKPKEHTLQWVATTPQAEVRRIFEKDEKKLAEDQQREQVQKFLGDPGMQKKQAAETAHDNQQIDDFLKLLPVAFRWTQTGQSPAETFLHFEPDPGFHPPTREARVFSGMVGDLVVDNQQSRVRSMRGHLIHDVTFGGGLLGRLKEGSSFALEQTQVGPSLWQLTAIQVHLDGNALLFKSVALDQEDERSKFEQQPATLTLEEAAAVVMKQPE